MQVLIKSFHISYNVLDYIHDNNFQEMQTHTYIHTSRSIYSSSEAYVQIHNRIKWMHLHPRSIKHLKTCMQLVYFHARHKTLRLKPSMSLYLEENKLFSIRTDLVFELKVFGY